MVLHLTTWCGNCVTQRNMAQHGTIKSWQHDIIQHYAWHTGTLHDMILWQQDIVNNMTENVKTTVTLYNVAQCDASWCNMTWYSILTLHKIYMWFTSWHYLTGHDMTQYDTAGHNILWQKMTHQDGTYSMTWHVIRHCNLMWLHNVTQLLWPNIVGDDTMWHYSAWHDTSHFM